MRPLSILLTAALLLGVFGVAPARAACGETYTVAPGDTFFSIAEKCGINYVVLVNINYEISDPNLIRPGQVIRTEAEIPLEQYHPPVSGPAQPDGLQQGGIYITRKGDSLARIAYLYSTTLKELYEANPQLGGRPVIYTGQRINLPTSARLKKGWVGVSSLYPDSSGSVIVRVIDFIPYAPIMYRLYQVFDVDENAGFPVAHLKQAGPEDIVLNDPDSVYIEGKTDARGSAHATIEFPYWAYSEDTWVVDVFTYKLGKQDVLARSPVMLLDGLLLGQ